MCTCWEHYFLLYIWVANGILTPKKTFMREKLLAALRAKYPGTQAALLDRVADTMAGTVTDETLKPSQQVMGSKTYSLFFSQKQTAGQQRP